MTATTQRNAPTFDELERYRGELTGYCYRMLGASSEAEDAVQETLTKAWRNLDRFEGRSSLRTWLYRIASNTCFDMTGAVQRRARPMDLSRGAVGPGLEAQLHHGGGVEAARAAGGVVVLLVAAAGHVVLEQPSEGPAGVVAGEERDDGQALHRGGQVVAHHLRELVGLALQRERRTLDLLVVLELELEELDHLHGGSGGSGDGDPRPPVGGEDLLDRPVADQVPGGGPTIAGHDDPVGVADGDDGGAVGHGTGTRRLAGGHLGHQALGPQQRGEVGTGISVGGERGDLHGGEATGARRSYCPPFCT